MRTRRRGRIGLPEADRLVAGEPAVPERLGLSTLLAAAAAPPFPEELASERAAVTGFARARRDAAPTVMPAVRSRARVPLTRRVAVKTAVGLAVVVTGGTAFAAATGSLPAGVQQQAHELFSSLGIPAPGTGARPTGTGPRGFASSGPPRGTPTASARGRTPDPGDPKTLGLCHAWDGAQKNPHGKAMAPEMRRALAAAAGDEPSIPEFCAKLLGGQQHHALPSTTPTPHPGAATTSQSHPGGGNGSGGNGGGNPTGHAHPTHNPDH
jgi:hypothetical protein